MSPMHSAMVLITYTPGPAARPEVYEPWLRGEDNPTFNRVPGIGEYSNWKLRARWPYRRRMHRGALADPWQGERL